MRLLLVEQYSGGHYDNYLSALLPPLLTMADEVVVATTPSVAERSPALRLHRAHHAPPRLSIWPGLPEISPAFSLRDRWISAQALTDSLRHHRPDHTLISSADPQAMGLALGALLGRRPISREFSIDATFHYGYPSSCRGAKNWIKRMTYETAQRHSGFDTLGFVNFVVYEDLIARKVFAPERIRMVGDPVLQPALLGKQAVRRMLGLDPDDFYLGLLGSIDTRKAVPELLHAFRAADLGPRHRLLLAGQIAAPHRELIDGAYADLVKNERLVLIDRRLSDLEVTHGYEALDLCTPLYYNFPNLASLALKALACRCPLFVADFGWMGAVVREFGLGTAVPLADQEACARGLRAAVQSAGEPLPAEPLRRLMAFHTPENFLSHMLQGPRRRLGLPPANSLTAWSWVRNGLPQQMSG